MRTMREVIDWLTEPEPFDPLCFLQNKWVIVIAMLFASIALAYADDACLTLEDGGILTLTSNPCDQYDGMRKANATHEGKDYPGCWFGETVEDDQGASITVIFFDGDNSAYNFNPEIFKTCEVVPTL